MIKDLPTPSPPPPKSKPPSSPTRVIPDCGENLRAVWVCHLECAQQHYDFNTGTYQQPGHAICKAKCPAVCSPPPTPPPPTLPSPQPSPAPSSLP
eukprot:scaffold128403_cov36-Phaeocystis_antarctica.AAC.1